jgi:hypothetical protein
MFPSATGQASHAVAADQEWFLSTFQAWIYTVLSLLFSAISPFLDFSTLTITVSTVTFPINWEASFA